MLGLQIAYSVQDVAYALGLDPRMFFYVVQRCHDGIYYREFKIPKKTGGFRQISQPIKGLALAQDRLAAVLNTHYKPKSFVKGFVKEESFLTNAQYHQGQRWIVNIDIKDFFPTIGFARVRGLFLSRYFGFNPRVSTILARICTYNDSLPQGSPTSPVIANILANSIDRGLISLAHKERARYTRYVDDITFSSNRRQVPPSLVKNYSRKYVDGTIELGVDVVDVFARSGFLINEKKSRLLFQGDRQEVTGLIVNEKANVWRRDVSRIRMKIHSAKKYGCGDAAKVWIGPDATAQNFSDHIVGWLAYIRQVRGKSDPVLAKLCKDSVAAKVTEIKWIIEAADMVREFDVFLSHASEDKDKMRMLHAALTKLDIKVFFDEESIKWGDSIVERINFGLLRSTYFMPYLTQIVSEKGWTNKELNSAISMNASQKGRILPIKGVGFNVDERYTLLNDTIYKAWPDDSLEEKNSVESLADEVLRKIELDRQLESRVKS